MRIWSISIFLFSATLSWAQGPLFKGKFVQAKIKQWYEDEGIREDNFPSFPGFSTLVRMSLKGNSSIAAMEAIASRVDIPVYNDPNNLTALPGASPNLFQAYYVSRITTGKEYGQTFLELVEWNPNYIDANGVFRYEPKRIGWVRAKDMIIWNGALLDKEMHYVKMLAVHSIESLKDYQSKASEFSNNLQLYGEPDLQTKLNKTVPLLDFLFMYKTETNSKGEQVVLLGRKEVVDASEAGLSLLGWAPAKQLQRWPGRLVLEPNYDPKAAAERKNVNFQYKLKLSTDGSGNNTLGMADPGTVRWDPKIKRIPLFDADQAGIYRAAKIYDENDLKGLSQIDVQRSEQYSDLVKKIRKLNLVLMFDGSEISKPYKEKIIEIISSLQEIFPTYSISAGAVIYRDEALAGKKLDLETIELTSNISDFARKVNDVSFLNDSDKDQANQNLLNGFLAAMSMFQGRSDQSNFVLLMGAGGDNSAKAQARINQIADQVAQNSVHILGTQFFNDGSAGYQLFNRQLKEICEKGHSKIVNDLNNKPETGQKYPLPLFVKCDRNSYCVDYPNGSPNVAYAYQSFDGEQFSSDDFATSFSRTFRKVQLELEKKISGLQNVVLDLQTKAIPVGIREFLSRNNVNVDLFTVNKIPLMVNCYIDSVYRDLNYYPYSKSVFLTRKEFTELVGFLERIRDGSVTQDETRKNVYNAIFEQIKSYFGKKEVKKAVAYMKTRSGRDFFRSLTGCDPNSPYIRKLNSLNDILKENVFTAEDMNAFVVDCKSKLNRLNNQAEMKRYSFEGTEQDYIWLPVTLLP